MRANENDQFKKRYFFILGLFLSFVLHLVVLPTKFSLLDAIKNRTVKSEKKEQRIKLKLVERKKSKAKQIVNDTSIGKKEKTEDAKFLSKDNRKVEREAVAKKIGSFQVAGEGVKSGQKKKPVVKEKQKVVTKKNPSKAKVAKKVTKKRESKRKKKTFSLSDLGVKKQKVAKKSPASEQSNLGIKNGAKGRSGLSQNNDFLEDLPISDMTTLNTKEFKYYSFYHRIRQKLEQHWGASLEEKAKKIYMSGRRVPASELRITAVIVTIDSRGSIVNVDIKSPSGIKELDDAAIESFNRAGPFPNPPEGILQDGRARIEWGFVVRG